MDSIDKLFIDIDNCLNKIGKFNSKSINARLEISDLMLNCQNISNLIVIYITEILKTESDSWDKNAPLLFDEIVQDIKAIIKYIGEAHQKDDLKKLRKTLEKMSFAFISLKDEIAINLVIIDMVASRRLCVRYKYKFFAISEKITKITQDRETKKSCFII